MEPLKRKGEATDKKIVLVGKKMTKIERKWAKSLLKAILSLKGKKTLVLSTEDDTSSITVSEDGKVGSSRWSEDIFLALVEKGVQTEGSLLIRSSNEKGGVLYGVILGRGGLRTLSVAQLGRLFLKPMVRRKLKM